MEKIFCWDEAFKLYKKNCQLPEIGYDIWMEVIELLIFARFHKVISGKY